MDPTSAAFMLDNAGTTTGLHDSTTLNQSLCLALANEQQAHAATKVALSQEIQRCMQLEEAIKRNQQQIQSLVTTVNNLGAIIKHNVKNQNADKKEGPIADKLAEDEEVAALKEFYRTHQQLTKNSDKPVLYDALKYQKEQHGARSRPVLKEVVASASGVNIGEVKELDDTQLFNLDLLKSPPFDDSPASALRRTLRKHFMIAETENQKSDQMPATPFQTRTVTDKLIDVSPDSDMNAKDTVENKAPGLAMSHRDDLTSGSRHRFDTMVSESKPRLLVRAILSKPSSIYANQRRRQIIRFWNW